MPNITSLYDQIINVVDGHPDIHPNFEDALRLHRFLALIEDASANGQRKTVPSNAAIGS
jgi:hypothetical protein